MYRRISYCALLGMEGKEERKDQAGKTRRDEKKDNTIADTAISLSQGSLRSPGVHKTWLQLQNVAVIKGNVTETVCCPDGNKNWFSVHWT